MLRARRAPCDDSIKRPPRFEDTRAPPKAATRALFNLDYHRIVIALVAMETPKAAQLCVNCHALEFDDRVMGGESAISADGAKYLSVQGFGETMETHWVYPLEYNIRDHLPRLSKLKHSARAGCTCCSFIRNTILFKCRGRRIRDIIGQSIACDIRMAFVWSASDTPSSETGILSLEIIVTPDGEEELVTYACRVDALKGTKEMLSVSRRLLIRILTGHEAVANWLRIPVCESMKDRLEPKEVSWMKSVIAQCTEKHAHPPLMDNFCPRRLIDVQSQPIKLVLAADLQNTSVNPTPKYAALSYCWGSATDSQTQLTTTQRTLYKRLSGINERDLPAVVRDAVSVAKSLGIPYLWADALCILQGEDGRADWEEQSQDMDKIYEHAQVTVGAVASESCDEGFRRARECELHINYRSTVNSSARGLLMIRFLAVYGGKCHNRVKKEDCTFASIGSSQWSSRAWTFGEQMSSTRLLAFGRLDLVFSCPIGDQHVHDQSVQQGYLIEEGLKGDWLDSATLFDRWRSLVMVYSLRSGGLTRPTDAFPAISGIAASFCKAGHFQETDYMAGHWKQHLTESIPWRMADYRLIRPKHNDVTTHIQSLAAHQEYVCPSWSWASSRGVEFPMKDFSIYRPDCQIESWTVAKGTNPFGEISSGVLKIVGKVADVPSDLERVESLRLADMQMWTTKDQWGHCWHLNLDWAPLADIEPRGKMAMLLTTSFGGDLDVQRVFIGLLIHEVGPSQPGKYYRVGMFESDQSDGEGIYKLDGTGANLFGECASQVVDIIYGDSQARRNTCP